MLEIRAPVPEDGAALADLKIEWAAVGYTPSLDGRADFIQALEQWMSRLGDSLVCRVAVANGRPVGMAWMVVYERVPDFDERCRLSGDVQSVYVTPELRGNGIGRRLIASICAEADRLGIPRVTVHSSSRALPLYKRAGFEDLEELLARTHPSTSTTQ